MKYSLTITLLLILLLSACSKVIKTLPVVTLKYDTDKGTLNESHTIDGNFNQSIMAVSTGSDTSTHSTSDSVTFFFFSSLTSETTFGSVWLYIVRTYPKSQLSFYNNSFWGFKNDNDFYAAFQKPVTAADRTAFRSNVMYLSMKTGSNSPTYNLADNATDPNNHITIESYGGDYDCSWLVRALYITDKSIYPMSLVKITFSGKLVTQNYQDTLTVQNLTYTGIFSNMH